MCITNLCAGLWGAEQRVLILLFCASVCMHVFRGNLLLVCKLGVSSGVSVSILIVRRSSREMLLFTLTGSTL